MALNSNVSFTWVGHGTWKVRSARGKDVLIDPWVMNNPAAPDTLKAVDRCDLMLITHGHFDHIHDAVEIARRTKPTIVCNFETSVWLGSKGLPSDNIIGASQGGTVEARRGSRSRSSTPSTRAASPTTTAASCTGAPRAVS